MNFTFKNIKAAVIALAAWFLFANIIVEFLRVSQDNPLQEPMSTYLLGPWGWLQSAAYIGFSISMVLGAFYIWNHRGIYWSFMIGALGMLMVVFTKWVEQYFSGEIHHTLLLIHGLSAAMTFIGFNIALVMVSWGTMYVIAAFLAPITTLSMTVFGNIFQTHDLAHFSHIIFSPQAIQEKNYTLWLVLTFIAVVWQLSNEQRTITGPKV